MRTDVKIGFVVSLIIVIAAAWYFSRGQSADTSIPIASDDGDVTLTFAQNDKPAPKPADSAEPNSSRSANAGTTAGNESSAGGAHTNQPRTTRRTEPAARSTSNQPQQLSSSTQPNQPDRIDDASAVLSDIFQTPGAAAPPASNASSGAAAGDSAATRSASAGNSANHVTPSITSGLSSRDSRHETHTVQQGDTLAGLARRYYGDLAYMQLLRQANPHVVDPENIARGTVVNIPSGDGFKPAPSQPIASPAPASTTAVLTPSAARNRNATSPAAPATETAAPRTHVVSSGDTLYGIALSTLAQSSRWKEIYDLNKATIGDDPSRLKIGQALKLPAR